MKFRIIKNTSEGKKYLQHIGHKHAWTVDISLAMEYTKLNVAQELAAQTRGEVEKGGAK